MVLFYQLILPFLNNLFLENRLIETKLEKDSENNFYCLKNTQTDKKFIEASITLTIVLGKWFILNGCFTPKV